jgi:hypothetical protein
MKKLIVFFTLFGLSLAQAKSFHVKLYEPTVLGSSELKPGDYIIDLQDQKVILKCGKQEIEVPVTVEVGSSRYSSTMIRFTNDGGRSYIQEIRLGGTNMKLVVALAAR